MNDQLPKLHKGATIPFAVVEWVRKAAARGGYSPSEMSGHLRDMGYEVPRSTVRAWLTYQSRNVA